MDHADYPPPFHTVVPLPLLAPIQHYICDNHLHSYLLSTMNMCNCWCMMTGSITMQALKVIEFFLVDSESLP